MTHLNSKLLLNKNGTISQWDEEANASVSTVAGDSAPDELVAPEAGHPVASILIDFASSADGRGFSLVSPLRRRGFSGHLIATGKLIPDQVSLAFQCGFDAVLISPEQVEQYGMDAWSCALVPIVDLAYASSKYDKVKSIWQQRKMGAAEYF